MSAENLTQYLNFDYVKSIKRIAATKLVKWYTATYGIQQSHVLAAFMGLLMTMTYSGMYDLSRKSMYYLKLSQYMLSHALSHYVLSPLTTIPSNVSQKCSIVLQNTMRKYIT